MKNLRTILLTVLLAGSFTFGFTSCVEEEVLPVESSGGNASTSDDPVWD